MSKLKSKTERSLFRKIINVFILLFIGLSVLLLLLFGFTQTRTFRGIIREQVTVIANDALNGKLSIGSIQGSILTSIKIYDVSVSIEADTLIKAEKIDLRFNPLMLLFSRIKVTKAELINVDINLLQDSMHVWNIEKLVKPTPEDTTTSEFPFVIDINNLNLVNTSFQRKSYENINKLDKIEYFNSENLKLNNLNLFINAIADIKNNEYFLEFKEFEFATNLKYFNLNSCTGSFGITDKFVKINNFNLQSDSSNVSLIATIDSINIFKDFSIEKLVDSPISFNLKANSFNFRDINSGIESFDFLKGKIDLDFKASGKIGALYVSNFKLEYLNTLLDIKGVIRNLNQFSNLFFDLNMNESKITENDFCVLMPSLELPSYKDLVLSDVSIKYTGGIKKFNTKIDALLNTGRINLDTDLDFSGLNMKYDLKFFTKDLNIASIINKNTNLNISGDVKGVGTKLTDLTADVVLNATNSIYDNYSIDSVSFNCNAKDKLINLNLAAGLNKARANLTASLDFSNESIPKYQFEGKVLELNLSSFLADTLISSNLNFSFDAKAESFNIDSLIGVINFKLLESEYQNQSIDESVFKLQMDYTGNERKISLKSDLMDFNISGSFSLVDALNILSYESGTIVNLIKQKTAELNPIAASSDSVLTAIKEIDTIPEFVNKKLKFDFDFEFNDFAAVALFLGFDKLDVSGSGKGYVSNDSTNFSINTDINLDYFINVVKERIVYLSGLNANIKFSRDNQNISFDNLFGSLSITDKRLYAGSEIKNLTADLIFNQSKLIFSGSASINGIVDTEIDGNLSMKPNVQTILLENLWVKYLNEEWSNKDSILVDISTDYIKLTDFNLFNKNTGLTGNGSVLTSGNLDLKFGLNNLTGNLLSHYVQGEIDSKLNIDLDFNTTIKGTLENPIINSKLEAKNIIYNKTELGNLFCKMDYDSSSLVFDLRFLDSKNDFDNPSLLFVGNLPVYLGTKDIESRLINNKELNINLASEKFNLNAFGELLPIIGIKNGIIQSNVKITGMFNNVKYSGKFELVDGLFRMKKNNLYYNANILLNLSKQQIDIDKFLISNYGGVKKIGSITGSGTALFNNFSLKNITAKMHGDLSVLSFGSRSVLPIFYGDLFIGSIGDWNFVYENEKALFTGSVSLKETNLVFSPDQNTYNQINSNYNYTFVIDSSKIDKEELNFQKIINVKNNKSSWSIEKSTGSSFDYQVKVSTSQDAKLVFVLSEVTNQKLTVEANGEINYESKNGETRAQGEFKLLTGSKLEFIKTFDATGAIRFESDVTNPYLNVEATYQGTHVTTSGSSEEVAVKLILEGTVDELGKNLASNPENISVYVGAKNIENGVADQQLGAADAFSFIVVGKFVKDLTAIDQTVLASQADMLIGSVLSSVANSVFGDAINNIQLSKSMGYTKFSVSGKLQNFKYSIGGTTDVFKNISNANLKIEYLFNPDFSIRLERKEPVVQTFGSEDKINEMGLKYRFQF
ncbi:MAG: hypothetical protein V1773_10535 [bacterium]